MQHFELEIKEADIGDGDSTITELFSPKILVTEPSQNSQKRRRTDESSSPPTPVNESEFGPNARSIWAFTSRIVGPSMEEVITMEEVTTREAAVLNSERRNRGTGELSEKANEVEVKREQETDNATLDARDTEHQARLRLSRQKGVLEPKRKGRKIPSADIEELRMSSRPISLRSSSSAPEPIEFNGMPARLADEQSRITNETEVGTNWKSWKESRKEKQLKRPTTNVNSAPASPPPRSMTPRIRRANSAGYMRETQVGKKAITVAETMKRRSSAARRSDRNAGHSPSPKIGETSNSGLNSVTSATRIRDSNQRRQSGIAVDKIEDEDLYRLLPIPSSQPEPAASLLSFAEEHSESTPKVSESVTNAWSQESNRKFTPSSFETTFSQPVAHIGMISQDEQQSLSGFSPRGRSNMVAAASLLNNSESDRAASIRWPSPTSSFQPMNRSNSALQVRKNRPEAIPLSQDNIDNNFETASTSIKLDAQKTLSMIDSQQRKQTSAEGSTSSGRATQESETYLLLHGSQEPISVDQSITHTAKQSSPTRIAQGLPNGPPESRSRRRSSKTVPSTFIQLKLGDQDGQSPSGNPDLPISEQTAFKPSSSTDLATFLPYTDFSFAANPLSEHIIDTHGKCIPCVRYADHEAVPLNLTYGQYEAVRDEDIMSVSESSEDDETPRPRSREENRREIDPLDVTMLTKATRLSWSNLLTNGRATARNIARMRAAAKPVTSGLNLGNDIRRRQTIAAMSETITSSKSNRSAEAPSTPLQEQTSAPITEPPLRFNRIHPGEIGGESVRPPILRHLPDLVSISKPDSYPLTPSRGATQGDHESIKNYGLSVGLRPEVQSVEGAENALKFPKETVMSSDKVQPKPIVNQIEPSNTEGTNEKHSSIIVQTPDQSIEQTNNPIESTPVLRNPDDQVQTTHLAGSLDEVIVVENHSDALLRGQATYGGLTTTVAILL